jgi:hypothetical protein
MRRSLKALFILFWLGGAVCFASFASAEEFFCEILSVKGDAHATDAEGTQRPLKEGDLLKTGETLEVAKDSFVDLAYDKEWKNVTRLEAETRIKIRSVFPAKTDLEGGGIFAKLKELPKNSSLEVTTPAAVAVVRGTEYRTTFTNGKTEVFNLSESQVYVYGMDTDGQKTGEPAILTLSQKTDIDARGQAPAAPKEMSTQERQAGESLRSGVEQKIKEVEASGRVGKIQDIRTLERAAPAKGEAVYDGESRVSDTRRRPFKQDG